MVVKYLDRVPGEAAEQAFLLELVRLAIMVRLKLSTLICWKLRHGHADKYQGTVLLVTLGVFKSEINILQLIIPCTHLLYCFRLFERFT